MGKIDCGHYTPVRVVKTPETVVVEPGQSFRKVVTISDSSDAMPFNHIIAKEGSFVDVVVIILPGVSIDVPVAVDVTGSHAEVNLSGIYICGYDEKVNISTDMRHTAGDCKSVQVFNGIAGGTSHPSFYGKIVIAPDAQKIEAYQTNRNILISDNAIVNTKPQLEIYADDVKCSHGATVGKLNEDELFYMRSRGIPMAEARVLQMISFLTPVLEHIADEEEREKTAAIIEAAIRNLS